MKRGLCLLLSMLLVIGMLPSAAWAESTSTVRITGLETCGLVDPLGIDAETPVFDWRMESERVGASQSAYKIIVKDDAGHIVWDSGTVESDLSTEIFYAGETLRPQTAYTWQVTVTDEQGNTWTSEEASFETGLLSTSLDAWDGARWIGADAYPLDAASACVFDLSMTMQLSETAPRAGVVLGGGDFRRILEGLAPGLALETESALKKVPKGFPADSPDAEFVKLRNFCLVENLDDSFILSQDLADRLLAIFQTAKPFLDYVNRAIDYCREERKEYFSSVDGY